MDIVNKTLFYEGVKANGASILLIAKFLVIALLSIPILIRIFLNWLNSKVYVRYLANKLHAEYVAYSKTKEAVKKKEKELCDPKYDSIYKDIFYSENEDSDQASTELVKKLIGYLNDDCRPMTSFDLIKYIRSDEYKSFVPSVKTNDVKVYNLPIPTSNNDAVNYAQYVQKYASLQGVSITKFCQENKINESEFREYRRKHLKNKYCSVN